MKRSIWMLTLQAVPSISSHLGRSAGKYPLFLFPATQPSDPQVHCFLTILGKKGIPSFLLQPLLLLLLFVFLFSFQKILERQDRKGSSKTSGPIPSF